MQWIVLLALIQGLTEFLPVSSSAHLIIPSQLFDIPTLGLSFDVAVHFGTLIAVVFYYRHTLWEIVGPVIHAPLRDTHSRQHLIGIGVASIPAACIGFFAHDIIDAVLRSPYVIAWTTLIFGLLLGWADRRQSHVTETHLQKDLPSLGHFLLIGLAQSLALIPGVSRSGITMTASLFLNHGKLLAANTSFLLSIPIISMASLYQGYKLSSSNTVIDWSMMGVGVMVSAITAWLCITLFMKVITRMGMMPFVIYRVVLAGILFVSLS